MTVKIKTNSTRARLAARFMKSHSIAIVFGKTICLHNCSKEDFLANTNWLRHEIAHVHQYKRYGYFLFILTYLSELVRKGYYNNTFEAEAREKEQDEHILKGITIL